MLNKPVFVIEDDAVYGKLLKSYIENYFPEIKEVKLFTDGESALKELHTNPSIVIIDYFLNSRQQEASNGLEILKEIKAQKPQTNIIVLSGQEKPGVILQAIRDFDCVYIHKDKESFNHIGLLIRQFVTGADRATLQRA